MLKRLLIAATLSLAASSSAFAAEQTINKLRYSVDANGNLSPITSGDSANGTSPNTPLTPGQYTPVSDAASTALTVPSGAAYAVVCAEGANHRYTWDGTTTPTASVGTQLLQNACLPLSGPLVLAAFRIITQSAGGTFTVSYGK